MTGPNYRGFLFSVSLRPGRYGGQAGTPQTLRRPYWKTYINVYGVPDADSYLGVSLAYGSRTDPRIVNGIKRLCYDASVAIAGAQEGAQPRHGAGFRRLTVRLCAVCFSGLG